MIGRLLCALGRHRWRNAEIGRRFRNFDQVMCMDVCVRCKTQRGRVLPMSRLRAGGRRR